MCDVGLLSSSGDLRFFGGWWWFEGKFEKLRLWCSLGWGFCGKFRCSVLCVLKLCRFLEVVFDGVGCCFLVLWMKW